MAILAIAIAGIALSPTRGQAAADDDGAETGQGTTMVLAIRQSQVFRPPWPVVRVSVADSTIADVKVLTPQQLMVLGKKIGSTDLLLWDENDQFIKRRVDVTVDFRRLQDDLTAMLAGAQLRVSQTQDVVTISGTLRRAEHSRQLRRFLDASGLRYVDLTTLAGGQQVQIKVRVAEVSRNAVRALGVNSFVGGNDFFGGLTIGSASGGPLNPISIGPPAGASASHGIPFLFTNTVGVSPGVTIFGGVPSADLEFFVQALAENQYMRILAEPSLIALSGEEASFLVGGEYPIPVVQGSGTSVSTSITIEYREFGVRLRFKPTVLGDGAIRLFVAPEVSQLSDVGAVEIEGFRIPSLLTRKAQTELKLSSGQTFAMAGLISRVSTARNSRIPVIGDIPILGTLFRSVRYQTSDTELVILVTASLIEPMNKAETPPTPGILHTDPNDWELFCEGRLQGRSRPLLLPSQAARLREMGLAKLKGPGAWATYQQRPARSRAPILAPSKLPEIEYAPPPKPAEAPPNEDRIEPAPGDPAAIERNISG